VLIGNLLSWTECFRLTRTRELALARKVLFTLKARRELAVCSSASTNKTRG